MKTILIITFLLMSTICYGQSVNSPLHHDKQKHILIGFGVGSAIALALHKENNRKRFWIATGTVLAASVLKEIYDHNNNGNVEALDVIYGTLASAGGAFITIKLNRKKK